MRDGPTGVGLLYTKPRNPFRNEMLKRQFDAVLKVYDDRHTDLVRVDRDGRYRRHLGNAWATQFWRGFDGHHLNWDADSRQSSGYAYWKAGFLLRQNLPTLPLKAFHEPIGGCPDHNKSDPANTNPLEIEKQITLTLPPQTIETLNQIAKATSQDLNAILTRATDYYLAGEGQDILNVAEGIEQLDRGESRDFDDVITEIEERVLR